LLLAAAIGLPWLPALDAPPESLPMRRASGRPGVMIRGLALSPDAQAIATADCLERVTIRRAARGWGLDRSVRARGTALAFSPDGRRLVVGGREPDIVLCDPGPEGPERPLGIPVRETSDLSFSPDGRTLAVSSFLSHEIILWDLETGRRRMTLRGHSWPVLGLAFSPGGRSLASAARTDRTIRVWDLDSRLSRPYVSGAGVSALAYSPDGGLLAALVAYETCVRIWDARTHEPLPTFAGHSASIRSVAFSPDGRMMATAAGDGTAAVWSVATRRELRRLDGRADLLSHVAFWPDGLTLVGTGNDDDIWFWDLRGLVADRAER
jgi:WD40 repeat protein